VAEKVPNKPQPPIHSDEKLSQFREIVFE